MFDESIFFIMIPKMAYLFYESLNCLYVSRLYCIKCTCVLFKWYWQILWAINQLPKMISLPIQGYSQWIRIFRRIRKLPFLFFYWHNCFTASTNVSIKLTHFYVKNYVNEFKTMSVGVSHVRLQILYCSIFWKSPPLDYISYIYYTSIVFSTKNYLLYIHNQN